MSRNCRKGNGRMFKVAGMPKITGMGNRIKTREK